MKAILCTSFGPPENLVLEEVPSPKAASGQAVVEVRACGVNFPDTLIIAGQYQFRPDPPFSPGAEAAGVVIEVGAGVTDVKVGDRVVTMMPWGAFAERIATDANRLLPIPDGLDFAHAAGMLMTYGTSYHALVDRARLKRGETLLVLGAAGGVGMAAIELGKLLGARVIAAASSAEKLAACTREGADLTINYASEDLKDRIKTLTGGAGADVVYDPVGGKFSEAALRGTAWNGRFLVVGFAAGEIPKIPLNLPLLKGASVVGVFFGQFLMREPLRAMAQARELLGWAAEGKLKPHLHAEMPLAEAGAALRLILDRKVQGKLVLVP